MNDFDGLLSTNYGFKPSNKPMAAKSPPSTTNKSSKTPSFEFSDFDNVFSASKSNVKPSSDNFDSIFGGGGAGGGGAVAPQFYSAPVFDKPVYDDEEVNIFAEKKSGGGLSGGGGGGGSGDVFDDLLGGLGKKEGKSGGEKPVSGFDDLLPGFGSKNSSVNRGSSDATKKSSSVLDDPFDILKSTSHHVSSSSGVSSDPLEKISDLSNSGRKNFPKASTGGVFDEIDPLDGFGQSMPPFYAEKNEREKDESPQRSGSRASASAAAEGGQNYFARSPEKEVPVEDFGDSRHNVYDMPSVSADSSRPVPKSSSPVYNNASYRESYSHGHVSPPSEETMGSSEEIWLTVSEIPLFTQPTAAPPPSRPPPPRSEQFSRAEYGSFPASNAQSRVNQYSSFPASNPYFQGPKSPPAEATSSFASHLDELEEFAAGRNHSNVDENSDVHFGEDFDTNSAAAASAAAMKEAMDRAEAKFKYAKGVRERENAKASRSRESVSLEKEGRADSDAQDREFREGQERLMRDRQLREREEEDRKRQEEEDRKRQEEEDRRRIEKEREEKEREKRRVERERELARQAVERATKEARERAAIEARTRAERAAVQKANSEARERAGRVAVQRAQAEARERAAADAKERAEKAAAETREKARTEAREKEARERASAASMANEQKNEPDFDAIFGVGPRAGSAPRPRPTSSGPFETQFQSKPAPDVTRTSTNSASNMRKASSSTNIVDDLSSIFGAPSSSGDFPDVNGETEDRRRARWERHQRTQERATKALAEKNARDLEAQREQTERHRISETLDVEIKRWAAGKEGNLRALLATLQYVLWPECGWQPVSLTDLLTGASVKKFYRKATLCIHPDKVQQKGANLQQKYVAEKVFDMLKEAWNKFNSEELF